MSTRELVARIGTVDLALVLHEGADRVAGASRPAGRGLGRDHHRPGGRHRARRSSTPVRRRAGAISDGCSTRATVPLLRDLRPAGTSCAAGRELLRPMRLGAQRRSADSASPSAPGCPDRLGRTGVISTPHGTDRDPGVRRRRHQGHGQGGAAREHGRARRPGRAGQRLPPLPAAGRRHRRRRRRAGRLHELARPDLHRQRRVPGDVARGRLQEGAGHEHRRPGRRRRDRRGQDPAGPGGRRRGDLHLPPGRQPAPVHPGELDADPASARRRHHASPSTSAPP